MKKFLVSICLMFVFLFACSSVASASTYLTSEYEFLRIERGTSMTCVVNSDDGIYYGNLDKWGVNVSCSNYGYDGYKFTFYANDYADCGTCALNVETQDGTFFQVIYIYVVDTEAPDLYCYSKTKTSATVEWTKTDVGRYELQYRVKGGTWKTATPWTKKTKYTVTGLKSGKTYQFRVRSVNYSYEWDETYGYWSPVKSIKTKS